MILYVLGFAEAIGSLADARSDETGLLLDQQRLPQRVRPKSGLQSLRTARFKSTSARSFLELRFNASRTLFSDGR